MADYFTMFSVIIPLPDEAAQRRAIDIAHQAVRVCQGDDMPEDFPQSLTEVIEVWNFDTDPDNRDGKWGIWMHGTEGGVDAACAFIQHLQQHFDLPDKISFEWSNDCSKPRTDAYGGGAVIITAKKIKSMSTSEWLQQNGA